MKYYIAARYDRLGEMNQYARYLREAGHEVDCRWLLGTHQLHPNAQKVDADSESVPMDAAPFAQDDVEDVAAAEVLLFFSEKANSHSKRGGRHVEFGLALGLGKKLIIIGPRENVFHCLPGITRYETFAEFLNDLIDEQAVSASKDKGE